MSKHTAGPWFVSGVRFRMNGNEWHSVNRYDADKKADENIACVGYDPRTGVGFADAHLIASAPELLEALKEARAQLELYETERSGEAYNSPSLNAVIAKAEGRKS